jgi:hypothetical protein
LGPFQGPNRGLLIHAQDHRMVGRRKVNPHQVARLGGKLRVGRNTPTVSPLQADTVTSQHAPELARQHVTQGTGGQATALGGITGRGRLIQQGQGTPLRLLPVTPPGAGPQSILQTDQPLGRETPTPLAHRSGPHPKPLRDGGSGGTLGGSQNRAGAQNQTLLGRGSSSPVLLSSSFFSAQFNGGSMSRTPSTYYGGILCH